VKRTNEDLRQHLLRIDGRGYKAYKEIKGVYSYPFFTFHVDHVQGDPYADPSKLRVLVPLTTAAFPADTYHNQSRREGLCSFLADQFSKAARSRSSRRGTGKSGFIQIDGPGQEILSRTSVLIFSNHVEARFKVGLPASGRRILGKEAAKMLCEGLPEIVTRSLLFKNCDESSLRSWVEVAEDADCLRDELTRRRLVAFVANGSVLPRYSGVNDRPLNQGVVVPFKSPASFEVEVTLPNRAAITGMGLPEGVTLVVGGGFHGKSTLLKALEVGIYNHKPGDGREMVVSLPSAVKIRSEDGRRVTGVDITPFINNLPFNQDTGFFSTENASGSTSQASNIIESIETGAKLLLIDEDTAATNFMIRDHRMQQLILKDKEPITPFIDRVRQIYNEHGVSTILVIGGCGDYFDVADTVISMEDYAPRDLTAEAKQIASRHRAERKEEGGKNFGQITHRIPLPGSINPRKGAKEVSIKTHDLRTVAFGAETIDLDAVDQLVDRSQTRAIADAILYARTKYMDGSRSLTEVLDLVLKDIEKKGLDILSPFTVGDYAEFRSIELAAAINRLRSLEVKHPRMPLDKIGPGS